LKRLESKEVIHYSYHHKGSVLKAALGRVIAGSSFLYFALVFPNFFFKLIFGFLAFSLLAQPIIDFVKKQILQIEVSGEGIKILQGFAGHKSIFIEREDIVGIDVIEGNSRPSRRNRKQPRVRSKIIYRKGKPVHDYSEDAVCVIQTKDGNFYEIEKRLLNGFEFEHFMTVIDKLFSERLPQPPAEEFFAPKLEIKPGLQMSEEERKIEALLQKNRLYRDEDLRLKSKFQEKLNEGYKTIYTLRSAKEAVNIAQENVIHTISELGTETFFVFENDFKPKLSRENIEIGLQLIETAKKNLKLVEMRISYYAKIEEKLLDLKFQEESRRKLQNLTKDLEDLQNKNTDSNIKNDVYRAENSYGGISGLDNIEDLTQSVHNLEDLEKAIELNEYISFFTGKGKA
jgi:hypothetical protein